MDGLEFRLKERGVVIPIFAMLLTVIFALVAFVVDFGRANASLEQARADSKLLALAAVEEFYESRQPNLTRDQKLENVRLRVNELVGTTRFVSDHSQESLDFGYEPSTGPGGIIQAGRWHVALDPTNPVDPPCEGPAPHTLPCFQPYTYAEAGNVNNPINAFRIQGNYLQGISTMFARVMGGPELLPMHASGIAAVRPRRVFVVTDNSRSMVRLNYRNRAIQDQIGDPTQGRGSQYAYFVSDASGNPVPNNLERSDYEQWRFLVDCAPEFNTGTNSWDCDAPFQFQSDHNRQNPTNPTPLLIIGAALSGRGDAPIQLRQSGHIHFWDDYLPGTSLSDWNTLDWGALEVDPLSLPAQVAALDPKDFHPQPPVDCPSSGSFLPRYCARPQYFYYSKIENLPAGSCGLTACTDWAPQPLADMFAGLKEAVNELDNRRVSGDSVGMIFFDNTLPWTRITSLNDNLDYIKVLADRAQYPGPARKLGLFAGARGYTDIIQAVDEAMAQFQRNTVQNPGFAFEDHIILVSDGLVNCTPRPDACNNIGGADFNHDGMVNVQDLALLLSCFGNTDGNDPASSCYGVCGTDGICDIEDLSALMGIFGVDCAGGCSNRLDSYMRGMYGLAQYVTQNVRGRATLHALLVGEGSGPHMLDIQHPTVQPPRCYTEDEARAANIPLIRGNDIPNGTYIDWLNAWQGKDQSPPQPFYQAGADLYYIVRDTGGVFAPILAPRTTGCDTDGYYHCTANDNSRITQDLKCGRSTTDQVKDYMKQIINAKSTFLVVGGE